MEQEAKHFVDADQATWSSATGLSSGKWHPSFCSADADTIIRSEDKTFFRVHSHTLKLASGWFRAMFTLPQPSSSPTELDVISLSESGEVLAGLLKMISAMELPGLSSVEFAEAILLAAEKYDMSGPVSIIRTALFSTFMVASPIRLYGIAYRRAWAREVKEASSRTLTLDLFAPEAITELNALDGSAVAKLLHLQRRRRDTLRAQLDDPAMFAANHSTTCGCGQLVESGRTLWQAMKYSWISRMERNPFGQSLTVADLDGEELRAVLEAQCHSCKLTLYNRRLTCTNLQEIIALLPQTIEFSSADPEV